MANDNADMIVQLTVGDLRRIVREEVAIAVGEHGQRAQQKWVDVAAAAEHFGCSVQTVRNWIRAGAPARQVGTATHPSYRLNLSEFDAWAKSNCQRAAESRRSVHEGCQEGQGQRLQSGQ